MLRKKLASMFPFSLRDTIITALILAGAMLLCLVMRAFEHTDAFAAMLFILAVFLVARFTNGYLFGVIASVVGVLAVNYMFTYPYFMFNFSLTGYPLTIICMLAVSIVTSALTTQAKLQETMRVEMEREKTRSNLLRAISHDLRTPLTVILGANSTVLENYDMLAPDERDKMLREINEEAQWLIRVVENLLTVTRMDDPSQASLHKQTEVVEELVAAAVTQFHRRFPESRVNVSVPDEVLMAPMDAMLIEQVLINLLENAAMHATGSEMTEIKAYSRDGSAVFEVSDNGCGIPPSLLKHLFDGTCATDRSHRFGEHRSMGIGLSVCNSIIIAHGGEMSAENRKEGGACFRFTLPLEVLTEPKEESL